MRLLLDTQIFIWWDSEPDRLPKGILQLCEDDANTLVMSVASVWEMQLKVQLGKLDFDRPLPQILREQQDNNRLEILPVEAVHVFGRQVLPLHHKDPFDRMLIAQAITEGMPVLSVDQMFQKYPVQVIAN